MNNKIVLVILLFISLPATATRIVKFENNTDIPEKLFSYFIFSFHSPNTTQAQYSAVFFHFVKQADLDNMIDHKTKKKIPAGLTADLKVVTDQPSGLYTPGLLSKQPIPLTGSQTNLAKGTYNISEYNFALHFDLITPIPPIIPPAKPSEPSIRQ